MLGVREQACRVQQKLSSKVMYGFPKKKPEAVTTMETYLRAKTTALLSKKMNKKRESHSNPQDTRKVEEQRVPTEANTKCSP